MPSYIKLEAEGRGILEYLKCYKTELYNVAGSMIAHRARTATANGTIWIDRGYTFPEAGTCYGWQYYNWEDGKIVSGDMVAVILRVSGSNLLVVDTMQMTQDMDGRGIWNHDGQSVTVQAGDMIGFWCAETPSADGMIPQPRYDRLPDSALSTGASYILTSTEPQQNDTFAVSSQVVNVQYRLGCIVGWGDSVSGTGTLSWTGPLTSANDAPYTEGNGPITPTYQSNLGASTSAPEYYMETISGSAITNHGNLFGASMDYAIIPPASEVAIYVRLDDAPGTGIRVGRLLVGSRNQAGSQVSLSESYKLYFNNDSSDDVSGITDDWIELYSWPGDSQYTGIGEGDPGCDFIHLAKTPKWLHLRLKNESPTTSQYFHFFGIYPVETAVDATGKYYPDFQDLNSEYVMATYEGASFFVTQDTIAGTVIHVDHADAEDFNGLAATHSIWVRTATTRTRHEISAVNAVAKTITLAASTTVYAGSWLDSRMIAVRVDGYDSSDRKIRESPPIIIANTYREKWFECREYLEGAS